MPSAGGQLPRQIVAPASASDLAIAKPKPASSETPATRARLPVRSIGSMEGKYSGGGGGNGERRNGGTAERRKEGTAGNGRLSSPGSRSDRGIFSAGLDDRGED